MAMIWLIELSIFLMTGILLVHAIRSRSPQFALMFWVSGIFMALLREIGMSMLSGLYHYGDFIGMIGPVPLVIMLLWPNLIYVSWEWTNNFLGREYFREKSMGEHLPLIFLTLMLASFLFESLFHQFHLIRWTLDPIIPYLLGAIPFMAPFAYGFTGVVFLKVFKTIWNRPEQTRSTTFTQLILLQPIVILIFMGLMLITNLLTVLVFTI